MDSLFGLCSVYLAGGPVGLAESVGSYEAPMTQVLNNLVIAVGIVSATEPFKAKCLLHVPQGLKLNKTDSVRTGVLISP